MSLTTGPDRKQSKSRLGRTGRRRTGVHDLVGPGGRQPDLLGACRELAPSKQESTTYEPSPVCKLLILGCRLLIPDRLLDRQPRIGQDSAHSTSAYQGGSMPTHRLTFRLIAGISRDCVVGPRDVLAVRSGRPGGQQSAQSQPDRDQGVGAPARRQDLGIDRGHRHRPRRARVGLRPMWRQRPCRRLRHVGCRSRPQVRSFVRGGPGELSARGHVRTATRVPCGQRGQRLGDRFPGQRSGNQGAPGHQVQSRGRGADAPGNRGSGRGRSQQLQ